MADKLLLDSQGDSSRHTGNGRIIRKMMRTLSLYETGDSNGTVSLANLKEGKFKPTFSNKTINDYAYYICRGGWPLAINDDKDVSLAQARDYYEVVVTDDIFSLKDIPPFEIQEAIMQLRDELDCTLIIKPLFNEDLNINNKKMKLKNYGRAAFYIYPY